MKKILLTIAMCIGLISPSYAITKTPAKDITVDSTVFNKNLNINDTDVQKALVTVDQMAGGSGSGTVTNVATSNGITGGPITTTGTISGVNALADGSTKGVSAYTAADFNSTTGLISLDYANGQKASSSLPGFLSSADWTTFNSKGSGTVTSIATTSPITGGTITGTGTIAINDAVADGSTKGAASFTANDFNSSSGNISLDYTNGQKATTSLPGFLSSTDWNTFNNKTLLSGMTLNKVQKALSSSTIGDSLIFDDGTNVGVGSVTPGQSLDVQGTIRASTDIKIGAQSVCQANGTNCPASSGTPAGGLGAVQYNNPVGTFAGTENIFSFNGTNIGMGTTNGKSLLDIRGNAQLGAGTFTATAYGSGVSQLVSQSTTVPGIGVYANDGTDNHRAKLFVDFSKNYWGLISNYDNNRYPFVISDGSGELLRIGIAGNTSNNVGIGTTDVSTAKVTISGINSAAGSLGLNVRNSSQTSVLAVENIGNVGIGSLHPGSVLDVVGTTRMIGFNLPTGASSGYVLTSNTVGIGTWAPASSGGSGTINSGTTNRSARYTGATTLDSSTLIFDDATNVGIGTIAPRTSVEIGVQAMNINGSNVGVGTTSPPNKLYVAGTTETQGFKLPLNPSSGYVLTSNTVGVGTWMPAAGGSASAAGGTNAVQYNSGSSTFAGTENRFSFNASNVGVGTSNATQANLEILKNSTDPYLKLETTVAGNGNVFMIDNGGNVGIGTNKTTTSGLTVMNGNVGIGTWIPSALFQVVNGTSSLNYSTGTNQLSMLNGGFAVQLFTNSLNFNSSSTISNGGTASGSNMSYIGGSGADSFVALTATAGSGTTDSIRFRVGTGGATETMRIQNNSGTFNVGIGTSIPGNKLEVSASDSGTTLTNNSASMISVSNINTTANNFEDFALNTANSSGAIVSVGAIKGVNTVHTAAAESGDMAFMTRSAGTIAERMRITAAGNVGIGSITPGTALDVQGTIRASTGTAGAATCWKSDKSLGHCTTIVDASGNCTCS